MKQPNIAREFYDAFQSGEFDRFDAIVHPDVVVNSSANFGNKGIDALKTWAEGFITAFAARIDLVDEILAIDKAGSGRAVATVNLHWTHVGNFFGLEPTGRSGTSIENLIMTIRGGLITRIEVADTTLDLVIYMHERGWVFPQNIRPTPLIKGQERPVDRGEVDLRPTEGA